MPLAKLQNRKNKKLIHICAKASYGKIFLIKYQIHWNYLKMSGMFLWISNWKEPKAKVSISRQDHSTRFYI